MARRIDACNAWKKILSQLEEEYYRESVVAR